MCNDSSHHRGNNFQPGVHARRARGRRNHRDNNVQLEREASCDLARQASHTAHNARRRERDKAGTTRDNLGGNARHGEGEGDLFGNRWPLPGMELAQLHLACTHDTNRNRM